MPETYFGYVVLKLDAACPSNSYDFIRRHDSEDKNNANSVSGFISPNEIENNAKLRYCYVPGRGNQAKYPFDRRFGIFAQQPYGVDGTYQHQLHVDDEDSDNGNYWEYSAEVFLTSVNGQILAKISAKNLQPGSNTLSWNTANISKGQYIAVIKHNSTMSSKHVILK